MWRARQENCGLWIIEIIPGIHWYIHLGRISVSGTRHENTRAMPIHD